MMDKVIALGGRVLAGKDAETLLQHEGKTSGVRCADGTVFRAQVVILATGSWTASSFPDLRLECVATGQSTATIQLTPEETDSYRDCPVVLDFGSGFYVFPPNKDGIMKLAMHAAGYTHIPMTGPPVSTPRTITSHAQDGLRIPKSSARALRHHLREVYPDLAEKPFSGTRLCWYADSPDGDWIISCHPSDSSLVLATAGSGHAYKFLPVVGRLVADLVQGILDPSLRKKFEMNRARSHVDSSRFRNEVGELDVEQLCSAEDLLPNTPST
jgi:glycine/D-amino acid oxidase-like deaminating enzyme